MFVLNKIINHLFLGYYLHFANNGKRVLPHTEIVLQNKRMAKFLEWLKVKRSKNRQDVYMEQLQ